MNLLKTLLARAFLFLFPNAGPEDGDAVAPDANDPGEADPELDAHDDSDDGGDGDPEEGPEASADSGNQDAPPSRQPSRSQRAIVELRERTQAAERRAQEAAERAEALERRMSGPSPQDREQADEEARLRDPNTSDMEKWQIQANRTLRQSTQAAQAALARANDDRDAASYERKAAANPLYDKYRDRVEAEVERARKQSGQLVQREQVLAYLVGQDVLKNGGKSKSTTTTTVPRGKSPGAKSDTPRSGSMTAQQKRVARLQDQII